MEGKGNLYLNNASFRVLVHASWYFVGYSSCYFSLFLILLLFLDIKGSYLVFYFYVFVNLSRLLVNEYQSKDLLVGVRIIFLLKTATSALEVADYPLPS